MKKAHLLGVITFLLWAPIPWLYFGRPDFLAGQPLSLYAVTLFLCGLSTISSIFYMMLKPRLSDRTARTSTFLFILAWVVAYQLSGLAPNWDCLGKKLYVSVAQAGSGCTTTCTRNKVKPCSGWSSCWNKFVSCDSSGKDQDGRSCQGCCFSCTITCPTRKPPSPPTSIITATSTLTSTATPAPLSTDTVTPSAIAIDTATITAIPSSTLVNTETAAVIPSKTSTASATPTLTPLPPAIHATLICDLWGDADWCRGNEILELMASDPQGVDVTIQGDVNGASFSCGSSCSVSLPEGVGSVNYRVISISGRISSGMSTWQRDATAASLDLILPALDGKNGWYISEVDVSAIAFDSLSGLFSISGSIDEGVTWDSLPIHLKDGIHTVLIRARDVAGNEVLTRKLIYVDTLLPVMQVTSHTNGEVVRGVVRLRGTLEDEMSGGANVEISLDGGGTWQSLVVDAGNNWAFDWKTDNLPNGEYMLLLRGEDEAGGISDVTSIRLQLDNRPPKVSLQDRWWVWESGHLSVSPSYFPIGMVQVAISDPEKHWPAVVQKFNSGNVPDSIFWDRHFGDGTLAPSGEYQVEVLACDIHASCSNDTGVIAVPFVEAPSITITASPTLFATVTAQAIATSQITTIIPVVVTTVPEKPVAPKTAIVFWQLFALLGLFLVITSASVADSRPSAMERLRETIQYITREKVIDSLNNDETN